jgi:ubiquinone/menaquinone biosynthesis C-methylase UbiE
MSVNLEIYNKHYGDDNVRLEPKTAYEKYIVEMRFSYMEKYGAGKDVLDVCCGTGSFLIPMLNRFSSAVGVDFSSNMLDGFMKNLGGGMPANLSLIEADAAKLPLADSVFDFVFSYTSLYSVPDVADAVKEMARVLRPGGHAVFDLGNGGSLNAYLAAYNHRTRLWPKLYPVTVPRMLGIIREAGLKILRHRVFQLLPMYEAPRRMFYIYPLLSPHWKKIMGLRIGNTILDEIVSGFFPFRHFAFRHLFVVRKP